MQKNTTLRIILGLTASILGAGVFALSATALEQSRKKKMKTKEI